MKRSVAAVACAVTVVAGSSSAAYAAIKGNNKANDLTGGAGANVIYGYGGSDKIRGLGGDDRLYPGTGKYDRVYGGAGGDQISAPPDAYYRAQLYGQAGWDVIHAGDYDVAYGGNGGDLMTGGYISSLHGGSGPDHLTARGSGSVEGGGGRDIVVAKRGLVTVYLKDGRRDEVQCSGEYTKIDVSSRDAGDKIARDCVRYP